MTTKAQQLKKEITQAFPELKFSVKTEKRRQSWSDTPIIYFIRLTVTGLIGSPYNKRQIEKIANKYRNEVTATYVTIKNIDGDSLYEEIMRMVPDYKNNWETVHKIADNDCSTVLPDGYYEERMSLQNPQPQEVITVTETIEKETIDTNDKWFDELLSDLTVGELTKEIESRMEFIINNSFGATFHSEISVSRLGKLLVATIDGVEYHVPLLLDALCNYADEEFDNGGYYDLPDYLRDCEYILEASDSNIPENSTKQDSQAVSEKSEYDDDYSKLKRRLYKLSWGELRKLCKFYGLSAKGDAIDIRRRVYDAGITPQKVDEFYYSY